MLIHASLCPMNSSVPIEANGIIPVNQQDVSGIPALALSIPDFEGQAILRIFSNSTQSEIACYSGVITNGATFSNPSAVGTVLGIFTLAALVASFATTAYVDSIATTRTHYAHSLSVFVVFAVLQHIFYTGTLSMNWPSVLVAFWSNFAWSGGMIYSKSMQNSINQLIGSNKGNLSEVGSASSGVAANGLGGGFNIDAIYKRSNLDPFERYAQFFGKHDILKVRHWESVLARRDSSGSSSGVVGAADGYNWYGSPVAPGLPLPGNFSGFAGTLAEEGIPASNAFITGLLWFLILLVLLAAATASLKWALEGLSRFRLVKIDRLAYFRAHWIRYLIEVLLRAIFIGFFMIMLLTMFEFSFQKSGAVVAIAALIFMIFFVGMLAIAGYACFYRLRYGRFEIKSDRLHLTKTEALSFVPWIGLRLESQRSEKSERWASVGSMPWSRICYIDEDPQRIEVHQDEDYVTRFGWLSARFRRTRWWFFAAWLVYEFIRACFYGGAAGHPMTQVFGLLVVEIIALIAIITMKPFEGARLNALMVYLLGFSKVTTVALSAAFDARFGLQRITTTVIGIVIIVIQGILASMLLIAIVIGCVSSYMSLKRSQSDEDFKPRHWADIRRRYFNHMEKVATDLPPLPPPVDEAKGPSFRVTSIYRQPKIEDEDPDTLGNSPLTSSPNTAYTSRANLHEGLNDSFTTVPFGAKIHRTSWSTRDLDSIYGQSGRNSRHLNSSGFDTVNRSSRGLAGLQNGTSEGGSAERPVSRAPRINSGYDAQIDIRRSRPSTANRESGKGKERAYEERSGEKIGVAVTASSIESQILQESTAERESGEDEERAHEKRSDEKIGMAVTASPRDLKILQE